MIPELLIVAAADATWFALSVWHRALDARRPPLCGMGLDVAPPAKRRVEVRDERYFHRIYTGRKRGKSEFIRTVYYRIPNDHLVPMLKLLQSARITPASEGYR